MALNDEGLPTKLFRAMRKDASGLPLCGSEGNMLGVRTGVDIQPDAGGRVQSGVGGLSVTPEDPCRLPLHVRPARLGGKGKLPVFELPVARLGVTLRYRADSKNRDRHGFIEPADLMTLATYQSSLGATQGSWKEFE